MSVNGALTLSSENRYDQSRCGIINRVNPPGFPVERQDMKLFLVVIARGVKCLKYIFVSYFSALFDHDVKYA